jgi:hypothetical protein
VRSLLVLLAAVLAVVPAALAGAARTVTAPAPVTALAVDGSRVAYATGRSATDCNRVFVWNLSTRGVSKLGRKTPCVQTSTENAIAAVSIAGTRVLWLHYMGGNDREWSIWTATTAQPTPKPLRFQTAVDGLSPLLLGVGNDSPEGFILPYAFGDAVFAVREDGGRRYWWRAPSRVVALAAHSGQLAVASVGGRVTILDASGKPFRTETFADEVHVVLLTERGLLVQRGGVLELRDGGTPRTWTIGGRARLEDANASGAFFVAGGKAHRLDFASGARRIVAGGTHVQTEGVRVAFSSGRTITVRSARDTSRPLG